MSCCRCIAAAAPLSPASRARCPTGSSMPIPAAASPSACEACYDDPLRRGEKKMSLMAGKQGLVMGVANERSLAWGIARAVHAQDARLAFTYQGDALGRRVRPLAEGVGSDFVTECDVTDEPSLDRLFADLAERWRRLDFVVHA